MINMEIFRYVARREGRSMGEVLAAFTTYQQAIDYLALIGQPPEGYLYFIEDRHEDRTRNVIPATSWE